MHGPEIVIFILALAMVCAIFFIEFCLDEWTDEEEDSDEV